MALEKNPSQKNLTFAWWRPFIKKGARTASDPELEFAIEIYESLEWSFAGVVICGVLFEFFVAYLHPVYDSPRGIWGPVIGDALVAIGLVVEVIAGMRINLCQNELTRRAKERLAEATSQASAALMSALAAQGNVATAAQDLAAANVLLAKETVRRTDLESQLLRAPLRTINNIVFVEAMQEFSGASADIVTQGGDSVLVAGFARNLQVMLHGAGWVVSWWSEPDGAATLTVRIVTKRNADELTLNAARALFERLADSQDLWVIGIPNAGGLLVDFDQPVPSPTGTSKQSAPIRILVGGDRRG